MVEPTTTSRNGLIEQLRIWIIAGGYILGSWALFLTSIQIAAWGSSLNHGFPYMWIVVLHRISVLLFLSAPLLLLVGLVALQLRKHWAKTVLVTYAAIWIVSLLGTRTVEFANMLTGSYSEMTFAQLFTFALGSFDQFIYGSVYAAFLLLSMRLPEMQEPKPHRAMGFQPIMSE